jgi:hypothetical protein
MIDFSDLLRPIAYILRFLLWLGWDFFVHTVGWSVGWGVFRVITLGQFPKEKISESDHAAFFVAFVVESVGLAVLALLTIKLYLHLGLTWHNY